MNKGVDGRRNALGPISSDVCCSSLIRSSTALHASVIIPALDEEQGIGRVLDDLPRDRLIEVVVVDNGSSDRTAEIAELHGARVVRQSERGYGAACLLGIAAARPKSPDILVFLDADYSDHPEEIDRLLAPIVNGDADFVVGSRMLGERSPGALLPQAIFGNWLACMLMRRIWGGHFTDLGPFRAIRLDALDRLGMKDRNYGWTVEMQIRAMQEGLRCTEVPVSYRPRIGQSKVTGTVKGTVGASAKILSIIGSHLLRDLLRKRGASSTN